MESLNETAAMVPAGRIVIDLHADGTAVVTAQWRGMPDASYEPVPDAEVLATCVPLSMAELRLQINEKRRATTEETAAIKRAIQTEAVRREVDRLLAWVPLWQQRWLYFSGVYYDDTSAARLLGLPVWLRLLRAVYVRSTDWLPFALRDRLGLR